MNSSLVLLLLVLLLLTLPQEEVLGFVHSRRKTIIPTTSIQCTTTEEKQQRPVRHHHNHGCFKTPRSDVSSSSSSLGMTPLPSSEDVSTSMTLLEQVTDPLLLQHITVGGALALTGDVIAQSLLSEDETKSFPPADWDKVRTAAFVAFGALYTGGAQHFIFKFLNTEFDEPLTRLGLAQFGFIPFCYYPTFLLMVPALRAGLELGFGTDEAAERQNELFTDVAEKIPATLVRNWFFWLPVQFVQFNFVPTDLQVTFAACFGVIWNAILSWSTASSSSSTPTTTLVSASSTTKKDRVKIE